MLDPDNARKLAAWLEHPEHKFRPDHADCERSRLPYWLLSSAGEATEVRCSSPNRCDPCGRRKSRENCEMIGLDALDHRDRAPEVWTVLSTRTVTLDMARFYKARELVVRRLRQRFDGVAYASVLEYTTGYGTHSEGERRPHWNLLLKGIGPEQLDQAADVIRRIWCGHADAEPEAQHVGTVYEVGGLAGYLAAHVHKQDQKPPPGFRGQRFNCSRDYFEDTTRAAMRERAAESIFCKAVRHRAEQLADDPDHELHRARLEPGGDALLEAWTAAQVALLRSIDWQLVRLGDGWIEQVLPQRARINLPQKPGALAAAYQTEVEVTAAMAARDEHERTADVEPLP